MHHKVVLDILNSSERLVTDFSGLQATSCWTDSMLSLLRPVRDWPGRCLSWTLPSSLFSDNEFNSAWWGIIYININPSESPLCCYNGLVVCKIKFINWDRFPIGCFLFYFKKLNNENHVVWFVAMFSMNDRKRIYWLYSSTDIKENFVQIRKCVFNL